jgi:hypothetical protein
MASPAVSTKTNPKKPSAGQTSANATNDTPITEEELKKKDSPITTSDVLRLRKPTNGINEKTNEG